MAVTFSFPSSITVSTFAYISGTEDASTADGLTGALRTAGGLSVAKSGWFGSGLRVSGISDSYLTDTDAPFVVTATASDTTNRPRGARITVTDSSLSTSANGANALYLYTTSNRTSSGLRSIYGLYNYVDILGTITGTGGFYGAVSNISAGHTVGGNSNSTIAAITAGASYTANDGTAVGRIVGGLFAGIHSGTGNGTSTSSAAIYVQNATSRSPLIYHLELGTLTGDGSTTAYGIKIGNVTGALSANYAIYTESGLIRFGDTTDATDATGLVGALGLLGGLSVAKKVFVGTTLSIGSVAEYADNAAALLAGLVAGTVYRTGDILKIVH